MYKIRFVDKDKIKILAFIVKTFCSEDVYAFATVYELFLQLGKAFKEMILQKRLWLNDFMLGKGFGQMALWKGI